MKTITVTYNIEDNFDEKDFQMHMDGKKAYLALHEISDLIRSYRKYGEFTEENVERLLSSISEELSDSNVYDLMY